MRGCCAIRIIDVTEMKYDLKQNCVNDVSGHHTGTRNYKQVKASYSSPIIKNHSRKVVVVENTQCKSKGLPQ